MALLSAFAIMAFGSAFAQAVSTDSISVLKNQKEGLVISKRINDNKLKLAKLENSVEKETQDMQATKDESQKSADDNGKAADRLTGDAQNKKLAGDASKSAKEAKRDAKKARKASASLENLKKDIASLKSKIAADESRLSAISGKSFNNMPVDTLATPKN